MEHSVYQRKRIWLPLSETARICLNGRTRGDFTSVDGSSDCLRMNIWESPIDLDSVLWELNPTFLWKWLLKKKPLMPHRITGHWRSYWYCYTDPPSIKLLKYVGYLFCLSANNMTVAVYTFLMSRCLYYLICWYVLVV